MLPGLKCGLRISPALQCGLRSCSNQGSTAFTPGAQALKLLRHVQRRSRASAKRVRLRALERRIASDDMAALWSRDAARAQTLVRAHGALHKELTHLDALDGEVSDSLELLSMATAEGDDAEASEARAALARATTQLEQLQVAALMSGPNDADGAELHIAVGAGGDDAEDWARMLLRMYSRWGATYEQSSDASAGASRNDAKTVGAGAGARAAGDGAHTPTVAGGRLVVPCAYAFGWLRREEGVHRLVRRSPFDAASKRHTSFARVRVAPLALDGIGNDNDNGDSGTGGRGLGECGRTGNLRREDLLVETMRSSGPGGQHANRTSSAVRLTHVPSGISVRCQEQRSQHQNLRRAKELLAAKMALAVQAREAARKAAEHGELGDNAFGGEYRRSWVLDPYQQVTDLATGRKSGDPLRLLEGGAELDEFMRRVLVASAEAEAEAEQAEEAGTEERLWDEDSTVWGMDEELE